MSALLRKCLLTGLLAGLLSAGIAEPANFKTALAAGDAATKQKNYPEAEKLLNAAATMAQGEWDKFAVSYRLSNVYFYQKKYQEAIDEAQKARDFSKAGDKNFNLLSNRISEAYLLLKDYPKALKEIEEQLKSPRRDRDAYWNTMILHGRVLMEQNKATEAVAAFKKCAAQPGLSVTVVAKANWYIGIAAERMDDLKTAKEYYRKNAEANAGWFTSDSKRRLELLNQPDTAINLIPDASFEHGGAGSWNRMTDRSYLPESDWTVDDSTAFHGKYSLRNSDGKPLVLQAEGNFTSGNFSVYLKSSAPHPAVKIEVFSYSLFTPLQLASREFKTTGNWQRMTLKLDYKWLSFEPGSAPVFIRLTPQGQGTVWADAAQLESGRISRFRDYAVTVHPAAEAEKVLRERFNLPKLLTNPGKPGGAWRGEYQFTVRYPAAARAVPVSVALPLAPGEWFGGDVKLSVRSENGKSYPAQTTVLARWPQDAGVRSVLVSFEGDVKPGVNRFTAGPANAPFKSAAVAKAPEISLLAEDAAGTGYTNSEIIRETETDGPLFTTILRRGLLCNAAGNALVEYTLRTRTYHSDGTTVIDATLTNPNEAPLVLKNAAIRIASGKPGEPARYFQAYDPETRRFTVNPDGSCGSVSGTGGTLIYREASLRHPAELTLNNKGEFTAWLWPASAKSLILSRKTSLHREFVYSPAAGAEPVVRFGERPVAMAAPEYFLRSDFFTIPLGLADGKFPFMQKTLGRYRTDFSFTPESIFKDPSKILHGVFNYGDIYGDGGWANLESFLDYSEVLYAVGTDDAEVLGWALNRALHYRDVDVADSSVCYHSSNHNGGVRYDFSHSWPQGIILHYLLTGDPRSSDVLRRLIRGYQEKPVEYKHIQDSRSLGRYLLGLADFYALTGSPALKKRFFEQLDYVEKELQKQDKKDRTVFSWLGRTDPFHVWYGCLAIMEMYKMTGDERLLKSFKREMDVSLNMDFYRHDLNELWPGLPAEKTWPIQLGLHSQHRGSLFFPLMSFYSEISGNPKYREVAALAAYAQSLRGNHYVGPMDILRMSVLQGADEKTLFNAARELRWQAASPAILNGNFSQSRDWFTHWHLPASRQMSYDDVVTSWPLVEKKEFPKLIKEYQAHQKQVSPWRGYARNYAYLDPKEYFTAPPSLRITLSNEWSLGKTGWLECAPLRVPAGRWKVTGAFRTQPGLDSKSVAYWNFTPDGMKTMGHRFQLDVPVGPAKWNPIYTQSGLKDVSAAILPTDKPGWRKFEFRFQNPTDGIATIKFVLRLADNTKRTNIWFDDIKLERIED